MIVAIPITVESWRMIIRALRYTEQKEQMILAAYIEEKVR